MIIIYLTTTTFNKYNGMHTWFKVHEYLQILTTKVTAITTLSDYILNAEISLFCFFPIDTQYSL